jgi:hypothetical protein
VWSEPLWLIKSWAQVELFRVQRTFCRLYDGFQNDGDSCFSYFFGSRVSQEWLGQYIRPQSFYPWNRSLCVLAMMYWQSQQWQFADLWRSMGDFQPAAQASPNQLLDYYYYNSYLLNYFLLLNHIKYSIDNQHAKGISRIGIDINIYRCIIWLSMKEVVFEM